MPTPNSPGHLRVLLSHAVKPASSLLSHTPRIVPRCSIKYAPSGGSPTSPPTFATESSAVLHPSLKPVPPKIVAAKGTTVTFSNGITIEDTTCGAAVACIGYHNERVKNAMVKQMDKFCYSNSMMYGHEIGEELATEIINGTNGEMSKVYTMCSGKSHLYRE